MAEEVYTGKAVVLVLVPVHAEGAEDNSGSGHLLLRHVALSLAHQLGHAD